NYSRYDAGDEEQKVSFHSSRVHSLALAHTHTHALARYRRRGRRVACNIICILQPTWRPLQIPRQRIKIDIASGEDDPDTLAGEVDLPLLNRGVGNSR